MGGFLGLAKKFTVDQHPKRNAIIRALINQEPYEKIAEEYGLTFSAVQRYAARKLRVNAAKALLKGQYEGAALLARIEDTIVYVQKMYDACDTWLQDPEDPSVYNLDERASELRVIYDEYWEDANGNERKTRKKDDLQNLLDLVLEKGHKELVLVETKKADPRSLILQTAQTLNRQLETLAKIAGVVQEVSKVEVNVNVSNQVISSIIQIVEKEVKDPEVLERIIKGIANDIK